MLATPEGCARHKQSVFSRFAKWTAAASGQPRTFILAFAIIVTWAVSGPLFTFSDTWQLVINTGTTIVTFLMVFLIQNTQNRDSHAMQLKLDELIRATKGAHNELLDLEELEEAELAAFRERYESMARRAREEADRRAAAGLAPETDNEDEQDRLPP